LRHKLADAFKRTGPKPCFTNAPGNGDAKRPSPGAEGTRKCLILPPLRPGTPPDFEALASLRGLFAEGLSVASARGLLRFAQYRGHAAWLILDGSRRVAQARRMDGKAWAEGVKAWTLAGSRAAWPVGIGEAVSFSAIAFCEGGPDLLAAHGFIVAEGRGADCAAVAMLGGCARVHPDALPLFAGKRVRLFPHLDETGQQAADRWAKQLADAGATVDAFSFVGLRRTDGAPVKDLCDLAAIHADDFENNRCVWTLLPNECEPPA
jgi:hypothetical protein